MVKMARFMVKVLLLTCVLLMGMLLGIHQAEHGIFSILGAFSSEESSSVQEELETQASEEKEPEIYIKRIDGEEVEVGYVGEPFSLERLEEKEEEWKRTHTHNRYSQIGNTLGDVVYSIAQKGAEWFANQLAKIL
jgi:hypothetical protein